MRPFEYKIDLMPAPPPVTPVGSVVIPVTNSAAARAAGYGLFGRATFHRKIIAAKTEGGVTSILCEYGRRRKWYPRPR